MEPTNLALARIVRDLERLRNEADAGDFDLLAYLIDVALLKQAGWSQKNLPVEFPGTGCALASR